MDARYVAADRLVLLRRRRSLADHGAPRAPCRARGGGAFDAGVRRARLGDHLDLQLHRRGGDLDRPRRGHQRDLRSLRGAGWRILGIFAPGTRRPSHGDDRGHPRRLDPGQRRRAGAVARRLQRRRRRRNGGGGGCGGGGASDIRIGGTTLADRVLVAGGGGGAGNRLYCRSGIRRRWRWGERHARTR